MHYFSTNRKSPVVSFHEAVLNGQPDDKGLYFPASIQKFPAHLLNNLADLSEAEIAFAVIKPYIGDSIADEKLFEICRETVDFPFPLVEISDRISALELFHGPTLAFKDVGARFMSRCLQHFSRESSQKTVVIVATSGDTGGAVASGFHNVEGVEVIILYPKGKVSRVQELQLSTLGDNVITLEVRGSFDDCQSLAKQALADSDLRKLVFLTSANSINIARWLPQQFYYLFALKQWDDPPPVFSVPSGNFGNLAAGLLANLSGLPVKRFIAACNANDVIPEYFTTGVYTPKPSVQTISNAMDVGNPSNFVRIVEMLGKNPADLSTQLDAVSISDERTVRTMTSVYEKQGYVLDPHGAVGYTALADHLDENPDNKGIFLETAHPVKFDHVNSNYVVMPTSVSDLLSREKIATEISLDYGLFKELILKTL